MRLFAGQQRFYRLGLDDKSPIMSPEEDCQLTNFAVIDIGINGAEDCASQG